tara:strand:- start:16230 stop:16703 length:474 start_codon:yes stop_codon:yes gene_type:complete
MRGSAELLIAFWLVVIRQIEFKTSPAAALWRFQRLVIALSLVLLLLLPLAFVSRAVLCLLLAVFSAKLWWQRWASENVESLIVDGDCWKLQTKGNDSVHPACRPEYFSSWLVLLSYQESDRRYVLPVFSATVSPQDFRRVLALARAAGELRDGGGAP